MPTRVSKILLLIEAIALIAPTGLLFITLLPGAFALLFTSPAVSLLVFTMGAALIAALRVSLGFCIDGVSGLQRVHKAWWWLCVTGVLISVAGAVAVHLKRSMILPANEFTQVLRMGSTGLLLMIPLSHVLLERLFRSRSPHAA